jgi:hypothetical protein
VHQDLDLIVHRGGAVKAEPHAVARPAAERAVSDPLAPRHLAHESRVELGIAEHVPHLCRIVPEDLGDFHQFR